MAYTQGNKRWTATFRSYNNTICRIDIYQKGYTGSFIQAVTCADNPFFFEEDESGDLLNDVIRYRTGYIRLKEMYDSGSTLALDDIYPSEAFDRYVEFYYGSDLVFNGYIQVQDFSNELVPAPKTIELPVISPLGLMKKQLFSKIVHPDSRTLGQLLNTVAYGYDYVCFPDRYGYPDAVHMNMKILSLFVSPWNENYDHSMSYSLQHMVMKGESYDKLIDGICKAFGWICHDTPTTLIFTAFDYEDTYCRFPVGHIGESGYSESVSVPTTAVALTDYFDNADKAANMKTIQPETGIEIKYEGGEQSRTLAFDRTYTDGVITDPRAGNANEVNSLCNLTPNAYAQEIFVGGSLTFDNDGKITAGGHGCVAWNGNEGIMISMNSWSSGYRIFYVRFYIKRMAGQAYNVTYKMRGQTNGFLASLAEQNDVDDRYIYTTIDTSHDDYVEVAFNYRFNPSSYPQLANNTLIFITDIKLDVCDNGEPYSKYRYMQAKDSDFIPDESAVSSSVTMPISLYRNNDRLIGSAVRTTKLTEYPYLFQPRKELTGIFNLLSAPTYPHLRIYSYLGKRWRIIAQRFDPWNDEMTLTMQHSPVL